MLNKDNLHLPGAKDDKDKIRMGLVLHGFPKALKLVSQVGTEGAKKYSDNGWKEVENGFYRYRDALYRHLFATDIIDPEFGLPHLAHAAWNLLAMLELAEDRVKEVNKNVEVTKNFNNGPLP